MIADKRIIFSNDEGGVAIIMPSPMWKGTIEELAQKDVPAGKSYTIVDATDIPQDREFRDLWVDEMLNGQLSIPDSNKLDALKDKKLSELKEYYESDLVRKVTHNNRLVYVRKKSIEASTYLRGRVRDNVEVTECEWFYDDGGASSILDLDGITAVNKLVIDKEQVIFKMKKYHQAAIDVLTTEAEVNSYDITSDINGLSWI